jgi:ribosomal protein S12 methylthiotransferase accessory factor
VLLQEGKMLKIDGIERSISAAETLNKLTSVGAALGVTRLADITGLDRVGIPVYSSIVPDSDDILSVYNGKGTRSIDAKVGALMEAIERQTALKARLPMIVGSYAQLRKSRRLLDPLRVNQEIASDYSDTSTYAWVEGTELLTGESYWVPAKLAGYLWSDVPFPSCFSMTDTTGLASGNNRTEAICHALCELAERDAWTFAELAASQLPRVRRYVALGNDAADGEDDFEIYPSLDIDSDCALLDMFRAAGLSTVTLDITGDLGVPTVFASVVDDSIPDFPMAHSGLGTHPNMNVALRRALTEVAQSRCVDIQAIREDIMDRDSKSNTFSLHNRRISAIDRGKWCLHDGASRRKLSEVASYHFKTIEEDLKFLTDRFVACGLDEMIVVDFTPECTTHSVVRVIVPGAESWATDRGRLGERAVEFWKQHA